MKHLSIILLIYLMLTTGCHKNDKMTDENQPEIYSVWECKGQYPWKLTFNKDGTISNVVSYNGLNMDVEIGGANAKINDAQLIYIYGPCTWNYESNSNGLSAKVVIEDMHISSNEAGLSYSIIDTFNGPLSEDGKVWNAEWESKKKFDIGRAFEKREMLKKLVFYKVEKNETPE